MEIVALWGKADNYDIVFTKDEIKKNWNVIIPKDIFDGQYVVSLTALGNNNAVSYYNAILDMVDGKLIRIKLNQIYFRLRLLGKKYQLVIKK